MMSEGPIEVFCLFITIFLPFYLDMNLGCYVRLNMNLPAANFASHYVTAVYG